MLRGVLSAVSSWADGFRPEAQMNETLPSYRQDDIRKACTHASNTIVRMRDFREIIRDYFPHRADALAAVDQAEKTLDEQHGGMDPYIFLRQVLNGKFGSLSPQEMDAVEKLCRRWMDGDEVSREFSVLYPLQGEGHHDGQVMSEERVSEVTVLLGAWIRKQKAH